MHVLCRGGADAAAALKPPPPPVTTHTPHQAATQKGYTSQHQPPTGTAGGAVNPEMAHLVALLGSLGIRKDGMEAIIAEFVKTQQVGPLPCDEDLRMSAG